MFIMYFTLFELSVSLSLYVSVTFVILTREVYPLH